MNTHAALDATPRLPVSWKRFQNSEDPHVPLLVLDEDGAIQRATRAARHLLEYTPDAVLDPCFFSHVHGRNLRRVMQDLAQMVYRRLKHTSWLLRIRTGSGRWRWYRATVRRCLEAAEPRILVQLRRV